MVLWPTNEDEDAPTANTRRIFGRRLQGRAYANFCQLVLGALHNVLMDYMDTRCISAFRTPSTLSIFPSSL